MDKQKRQALREEIARHINHGLSDIEIFSIIFQEDTILPSDLIAVIRDLMSEEKNLICNDVMPEKDS
jgi:hypothetical protein